MAKSRWLHRTFAFGELSFWWGPLTDSGNRLIRTRSLPVSASRLLEGRLPSSRLVSEAGARSGFRERCWRWAMIGVDRRFRDGKTLVLANPEGRAHVASIHALFTTNWSVSGVADRVGSRTWSEFFVQAGDRAWPARGIPEVDDARGIA